MKVFAMATIVVATAFIFAMNASEMQFLTAHAESSVRVTQSTTADGSNSLILTQSSEDGLQVECEGNLKCEIIADDKVVATSEDNNTTSTITSNTILNQSDIIQSDSDLDEIDKQELSSRIIGMVNRLLDSIFA